MADEQKPLAIFVAKKAIKTSFWVWAFPLFYGHAFALAGCTPILATMSKALDEPWQDNLNLFLSVLLAQIFIGITVYFCFIRNIMGRKRQAIMIGSFIITFLCLEYAFGLAMTRNYHF